MDILTELVRTQKKKLKLTSKEISERSGVNLTTVSNIARGQLVNPKLDTLRAICEVLELDLGDLNREGYSPFREQKDLIAKINSLDKHGKKILSIVLEEELSRQQDEETLSKSTSKPPKDVTVRVYDEPAAAGMGNYAEGDLCHDERFSRNIVPEETDFAVRISGESMMPTIPDRCIAFIRGASVINNGEYGIFILDGQAYCKQLTLMGKTVILHSLNPECPDVEVPAFAEFRTLGKVLGYYDETTHHSEIF